MKYTDILVIGVRGGAGEDRGTAGSVVSRRGGGREECGRRG